MDGRTLYWSVGAILFQGSGLFLRSQLWTINRHGMNPIQHLNSITVITLHSRQTDVSSLFTLQHAPFWNREHLSTTKTPPHQTSGFLRPRRARYSRDMVVPPPMKNNRGMSCRNEGERLKRVKLRESRDSLYFYKTELSLQFKHHLFTRIMSQRGPALIYPVILKSDIYFKTEYWQLTLTNLLTRPLFFFPQFWPVLTEHKLSFASLMRLSCEETHFCQRKTSVCSCFWRRSKYWSAKVKASGASFSKLKFQVEFLPGTLGVSVWFFSETYGRVALELFSDDSKHFRSS